MNGEPNNSVTLANEDSSKKRLYPIRQVLTKEDVSYAQLAQACKCSKQNMSLRFINDDCKLSDMEKMAADPVTQDWWKCTHPCFEKYAIDPGSEFYHDMKQIFYHP